MLEKPQLISLTLHPQLLKHGFWLYVWRIQPPDSPESSPTKCVLYVGRTGDSSSPNAAPPYRRLGQHLGYADASNALRKHLTKRDVDPATCKSMEFFAYGPIFLEQENMDDHKKPRDVVAALECKLASALQSGDYDVMNVVKSKMALDIPLWQEVREAYKQHFPSIGP